jgi:hypothetical protein
MVRSPDTHLPLVRQNLWAQMKLRSLRAQMRRPLQATWHHYPRCKHLSMYRLRHTQQAHDRRIKRPRLYLTQRKQWYVISSEPPYIHVCIYIYIYIYNYFDALSLSLSLSSASRVYRNRAPTSKYCTWCKTLLDKRRRWTLSWNSHSNWAKGPSLAHFILQNRDFENGIFNRIWPVCAITNDAKVLLFLCVAPLHFICCRIGVLSLSKCTNVEESNAGTMHGPAL